MTATPTDVGRACQGLGLGVALLLAVAGAAGCGGDGSAKPPAPSAQRTATVGDKDQHKPAPSLTLRQAIGQHMVFAYSGARPPSALRRRIARGEAAGVILFSRNVRSVAAVRTQISKLQRIKRPAAVDAPLLVMVDQEGGDVRRLPGPPAANAAATPTNAAARANGRAAGRLLRSAGVTVDLAPVVDVGRADRALANEGRTYDDNVPGVVAKASAFADGLRAAGAEPVLKHFPGFGAASTNTDDGATRIDLSLSELRALDLQPYAKIKTRAVMLSTAIYPRVDPRPAAFSKRWVVGELRGRLNFTGVAMTDDLQAPAVARFGAPAQLAFFAIKAGVDLPLFAKDYTTGARAAAGLERAVRSGALTRAQLDAGARRVLRWRLALAKAKRDN
ncbi:glycoside hydrolase family 3 N-terminal domain-containing protein [Baekduia sp.]|uniref:glycoside hydrolase family 3 N-terminal domain-containing protein n=1 Tax=Baekduia sp. TaxID=2600305 RepID=UPI002E09C73F|nr:glycoside hydrolase family 3 N-terminal domain-containing protein [Baekduia sp.]